MTYSFIFLFSVLFITWHSRLGVFFRLLLVIFSRYFFSVCKKLALAWHRTQHCMVRHCRVSCAPDGHTECVRHAPCTAEFIFNPKACDILCWLITSSVLTSHLGNGLSTRPTFVAGSWLFGRWPTNTVIHDSPGVGGLHRFSDCLLMCFPL